MSSLFLQITSTPGVLSQQLNFRINLTQLALPLRYLLYLSLSSL